MNVIDSIRDRQKIREIEEKYEEGDKKDEK